MYFIECASLTFNSWRRAHVASFYDPNHLEFAMAVRHA